MIKINEIFESIQGEGRFTGEPCLFIRVSKCTRQCSFCDTQYHNTVNQELTMEQMNKIIKKSNKYLVVITGGEPLLYAEDFIKIIASNPKRCFSFETNGDLLKPELYERLSKYRNVHFSCSPKDMKSYRRIMLLATIKRFRQIIFGGILNIDIKIVTDLKMNKGMIKGADYLMPLTTFNKAKDTKIKQDVWNYCIKNNKNYSERVHIDVWGYKQRGI